MCFQREKGLKPGVKVSGYYPAHGTSIRHIPFFGHLISESQDGYAVKTEEGRRLWIPRKWIKTEKARIG